jgi:signal transduction histidine kinase
MAVTVTANTFGIDIIPINDQERIEALHSYCILDTPPEEAFDNLAHILAEDFNVPIALITLVDTQQVFFKANVGMPGVKQVNRGLSLCSLAILSDEPTIFEKAKEEPCLAANPLVQGDFGLRFYAGAPIITPDGFNIGTVCIVDKRERSISPVEVKRLKRYAKVVMHEIEVRLAVKQKTEALEAEAKLRQKLITEAVIHAQEKERSQIGLELHDNVNQTLTTVKLYNGMLSDGLADQKMLLQKSSNLLQSCIDEIRSISKRLSAPTLGDIDLESSVRDLIESINLTHKVEINYLIEGLQNARISGELHLAVYRIIQEQLTNIIKHAEASMVNIELLYSNTGLLLSIKDNGKGFDLRTKRAGVGITNMKLRAESQNGTFFIASTPGNGCLLNVTFPHLVNSSAKG